MTSSCEQPTSIDDREDAVLHSGEDNGMQTEKNGCQVSQQPTQQLCRFYSQGRRCYYGKKCRFLHQRLTPLEEQKNNHEPEDKESNVAAQSPDSELQSGAGSSSAKKENRGVVYLKKAQKPCRYFLSGFCAMDDRCHFWHPQPLPPVESQPVEMKERSISTAPTQLRVEDLTKEKSIQLRDTEISQLLKRFPKDKVIVQEREDGLLTYYRINVEPTDPDWPFDLKEIDIMVSFPESYPEEVFTIDVPEDQYLPSIMGRHIQTASEEWLQAKHATAQLMGKTELLFRPFLRWFDRNLERLFIDAARQLKKEQELEKSGLQFIPYEQLKRVMCKTPDEALADSGQSMETSSLKPEEIKEEAEQVVDEDSTDQESKSEQTSQSQESMVSSRSQRGTEVRLLGLRLGESTATVMASQITVALQCNRCKVTSDVMLSKQLPCPTPCRKCGLSITATFRACMLHPFSNILGYLDLNSAIPVDLVLQNCHFDIGCLSCNKEDVFKGLAYGQSRETNCQHCHSKLSVFVEATQFQLIQSKARDQKDSAQQRHVKDPAIQPGKPLPDKGACKHYRQSHRWLRFPCCGKAYPCDGCHDEDQDHVMELATRMICGFCAKEQAFSNGRPCVSCGGMMTRGSHTSHWEGGLGCRNKVKMSRNDKHKYSDKCKTLSRKSQATKK